MLAWLLKKYGCKFLLASVVITILIKTNLGQNPDPMESVPPKIKDLDFGDKINWLDFDVALERNKIEEKPVIILFYSPECQFSKSIHLFAITIVIDLTVILFIYIYIHKILYHRC